MSPLAEVQLVTARELRKSFRSVKGLVLAVLTVAGGAGAATLLAWGTRAARENLPDGVDLDKLHLMQEEGFARLYGPETGKLLADCPYSLFLMFRVTLWLAPLLVALLNFDAVSGELQYRTVRFWTVRVRRPSYMVGKFLGAWLAVMAVTLGMNVIVWGATHAASGEPLSTIVRWGLEFSAISLPITAAWCAIATLVASQVRSPMLSLLFTFATFFGLWLLWVIGGFAKISWLALAYPNSYDGYLLSPVGSELAKGLAGTGVIAVGCTALAAWLFAQRDV